MIKWEHLTFCQAGSPVISEFSRNKNLKAKRTKGKISAFASTKWRKPLYCYLLHSSPSFPPFWHFDMLLAAWRSWALCLVLPRSGTEQQYAWAFSLHSPPPPSPLLSSERSIIQLRGGWWGVGGGGHSGQDSIGGRASLKQWHHLCRTGRQWRLAAQSPGTEHPPLCMCMLACTVSDQWISGYREVAQLSHCPHSVTADVNECVRFRLTFTDRKCGRFETTEENLKRNAKMQCETECLQGSNARLVILCSGGTQ